ncbi:MAG TPA: translocation/assembly module TamB domain-containing protein, partial [Longimicrobiaceae bacterium]|nr:translocation/assembly module TamB domain-containing protein [Longimicrobiaceae bacterium]
YAPGTVPAYSVRGRVAGLDLSALPGLGALPRTRLTGNLLLDGRGTTAETFVGRVEFTAAPGSTVGGIALTTGTIRVASADGVLHVDTLLFAGRGFRAEAKGEIGLTRNAGPLAFSLNAPNLALLRPFIPGSDTLPDFSGSVALSGTATGTLSQPSVGVGGQARGFRYGAYAADQLAFSFAGAKTATGWTGKTSLNGAGLQVRTFSLQALNLTADLRPGTATFSFSARRDPETDLTAAGTLELEGLSPYGVILDAMALRLGGAEWRLEQRTHVDWTAERGLAVDNLRLRRTGPGATGVIEAHGTFPPRGAADFRLHLEGISLAEARRLFPAMPDAAGMLRMDATLSGDVADPRLAIDARVDSLRIGGVTSDSLHLVANYAAGRMAVNAGVRVLGRQVVNAEASIPMRLSLGGVVPGIELLREQPLTATLTADSVPVALLTAAFPAYVKDGAGTMRARVVVGGTPAHPTVSGDATLENATLTPVQLGAQWTRINGRLSMHGDTVRVDSVTGWSGRDGRAFINGSIVLDDATRPQVDLAVSLHDFQVADNPELAKIQADASVRLAGRIPAVIATGTVRLVDGTIYIPSLNETREADIVDADVGALGGDTIVAPTTAQRILGALVPRNLKVTVGESVWLESPDARIQIRGDLVIDRPGQTNLIFGELDAVRGSYTVEFGPIRRQFDIVQGVVRFYGTPELNPSLDITAAYEVRGGSSAQPVTVLVHLAGTMDQPRVELTTSNRQPLSQSELASLLLFGRTGDQSGVLPEELLSGVVLQEMLANLLAAQIENALVKTGFVDYVRVKTRAATGTAGAGAASYGLGFLGPITIEAGKEIISNVYGTVELVDLFAGQVKLGAGIDWQITPTLSLRAADEPVQRDPLVRNLFRVKRQVTVDLRRRWEYGRPRQHPH